MKVLFAVSDDEISEAIVKEYKEQYKEIITYKNVYYFNAIIKEIERDQTYDRIVISEELEPFTNNNYDQIDKFMFEKLDNISDEMTRNTSIVLICIDRRSKGEPLLSKIFGIGLYNALMGNDRNIPEVCRLLRTPRSKKEAKAYYGLGNDEIEYQKETENSVTETEIHNILAHYKRLGKNEEKYIESFNNIAAQYNDTQLRLIIKYLPLNVKAVLETESEKYQSVMSFTESAYQKQKKQNEEKKKNTLKIGFIDSNDGKNKLSSPVVVPAAMKKEGVKKLGKKKVATEQTEPEDVKKKKNAAQQVEEQKTRNSEKTQDKTTKVPDLSGTIQEKKKVKSIEKREVESVAPKSNSVVESKKQKPEIKPVEKVEIKEEQNEEQPKRGRGRPRKNPIVEPDLEQKPKRGRGRPRKNPIPEEVVKQEETEDEDDILKVVKEDDALLKAINSKEEILEDDENLLPDFYEDDEEEKDDFLDLDEDDEEEEDDLLDLDEDDEEDEDDLLDLDEDDEEEEDDLLDLDEDDEEEEDDLLDLDEDDEEEEDDLLDLEEDDEKDEDDLLDLDEEDDDEKDNLLDSDEEDDDKLFLGNTGNSALTLKNEKFQTKNVNNETRYLEPMNFSNILTSDKKIVALVGTSKNGTSFIVNNLAMVLAEMGVKTAIIDLTKNKNSYYIFTKNEENLRKIAYSSFDNLKRGIAQGINVNKNLTVYTALPGEKQDIYDINSIIPTLVKNHNVILMDCDFDTPFAYYEAAQEIYLVQSMDILTIQPLTYFLKELKNDGVDLDQKARIIINKEQRIKNLSKNAIIGGISSYNDPAMSYMTKLFDKDKIINYSIPLDVEAGAKYLESLVTCEISLAGYSRSFIENLKRIASAINPSQRGGLQRMGYNSNNKFSTNMNSTLDEMKRKY